MFSSTTDHTVSESCVLILTHDKGKRGVIMYPVDKGAFETEKDKEEYENLFEEKAPEIPYAGVGSRYAERKIDIEPLREAKLEHMESLGIVPKKVDEQFWAKEELALKKIKFAISAPRGKREVFFDDLETPLECARRVLWQFSGTRIIDDEEFIPLGYYTKDESSTAVYVVRISHEKLMDDWICHQAERQTLTDWEKCPHTGVLHLLGVDDVVKSSYCTTHSGPVFLTGINERVDPITLDIMKTCPIPMKS